MKPGAPQAELPADAGNATLARLDKLRNSSGSLSTAEIRGKMQRTMQARAPLHCSRPAFPLNMLTHSTFARCRLA